MVAGGVHVDRAGEMILDNELSASLARRKNEYELQRAQRAETVGNIYGEHSEPKRWAISTASAASRNGGQYLRRAADKMKNP